MHGRDLKPTFSLLIIPCSVRKELAAAINALKTGFPNQSVYFVGHSLGGALATLAAAHYKYSDYGFANQIKGLFL